MIRSTGFGSMKVVGAFGNNPNRSAWVVCDMWITFTCSGRRYNDPNNVILAAPMLHDPNRERQYRSEFRKIQMSGDKTVMRNYHEWETKEG